MPLTAVAKPVHGAESPLTAIPGRIHEIAEPLGGLESGVGGFVKAEGGILRPPQGHATAALPSAPALLTVTRKQLPLGERRITPLPTVLT